MNRLKQAVPHERFKMDAAVYTAAVLEYMCAEVLEVAGDMAADQKRKRITPTCISLASTTNHLFFFLSLFYPIFNYFEKIEKLNIFFVN